MYTVFEFPFITTGISKKNEIEINRAKRIFGKEKEITLCTNENILATVYAVFYQVANI